MGRPRVYVVLPSALPLDAFPRCAYARVPGGSTGAPRRPDSRGPPARPEPVVIIVITGKPLIRGILNKKQIK